MVVVVVVVAAAAISTTVACDRKQKMPPVDPAVFACISMVSLAVGPLIAKDIHDIMESMFAVGLRYCFPCLLCFAVTSVCYYFYY